mmetsp:Transcript_106239/g.129556  ORF Transcript_106239/g.129556 Transcript_106239/m.129556 type:complete len:84 (-) Transcript_106239:117-368(-)
MFQAKQILNFDVTKALHGEITLILFGFMVITLCIGILCWKCNTLRHRYTPLKTSPAMMTTDMGSLELGNSNQINNNVLTNIDE